MESKEVVIKKEFTISEKETALAVGSGGLKVLATPVLAVFVESFAYETIQKELDSQKTSVGSFIEIHHIAPTLPGQTVEVKLSIQQLNQKHFSFEFEIFDSKRKIAYGRHDRIVVDKARFMQNAE